MNAIIQHDPQTTTPTPAAAQVVNLPSLPTSNGESAFQLAQRQAKAMASSTLVPEAYRNNVPNVMIAMETANRIGASPFLVMQNLYIVHGRPSWSSQFLIATVNACGRFTPLRYEIEGGNDPSAKTYQVRAVARDKETGDECVGPWITWKMVEAEGWSKKGGSKWSSIPDLMFRYRAATFWTRLYAPELSMGIQTSEELQDVWGGAPAHPTPTASGTESIQTLEAQLLGQPQEPADQPDAAQEG